jgi:zinc transport system permease protein
MLTYRFMQVALIVCILLGVTIPLIGSSAVFKRLSSSGDALAHSSLAGVAIGLAAGLNPLLISILCCIVSFLIIELLRKRFNKYSEIGVAVVLSAAIALAGILSNYTTSGNFDSYLFGSILLISDIELYITIGLTILVVLFSILFYPQIFSILYSENESRVSSIRVNAITFVQDLLFAVTIAVAAKVVGSLVVSCLVVLPTAIALQLKKGYKVTMVLSVLFSVASMVIGLTLAYYLDFKPGATIVMTSVVFFLFILIYRGVCTLVVRFGKHQTQ